MSQGTKVPKSPLRVRKSYVHEGHLYRARKIQHHRNSIENEVYCLRHAVSEEIQSAHQHKSVRFEINWKSNNHSYSS